MGFTLKILNGGEFFLKVSYTYIQYSVLSRDILLSFSVKTDSIKPQRGSELLHSRIDVGQCSHLQTAPNHQVNRTISMRNTGVFPYDFCSVPIGDRN